MHDRTLPPPPKTPGLVPTCKSTGNKIIDYAGPQVSVACYNCHCYCCCTLLRSTDASLLNTQHYKVRIKGKVEQSREGVAPFLTPWCSSYRKGSLRVTLDYGRQLYLLLLTIRWKCKPG